MLSLHRKVTGTSSLRELILDVHKSRKEFSGCSKECAETSKNPEDEDGAMFLSYLKDLQLLKSDLLTLTVFSGQMDGLEHEA